MLKIKDDVDLKELEKFGFKPKYDEDTLYDLIQVGLVEKVEGKQC